MAFIAVDDRADFVAGIAGCTSYALLWDKANHELYSLLLRAFGVGAGINIHTDGLGAELEEALGLLAQVDLGTFEDFTTREAYSIRDFHGTLFHMDTLEANAMIGWAYAHLWFPSLDVIGKDIDIGGWQLGNVGIGASHVVGPVVVLGRVANPNIRL